MQKQINKVETCERLKLEVQISVDGFMADKSGSMNGWLAIYTHEWLLDKELQQFHIDLTTSSDVSY